MDSASVSILAGVPANKSLLVPRLAFLLTLLKRETSRQGRLWSPPLPLNLSLTYTHVVSCVSVRDRAPHRARRGLNTGGPPEDGLVYASSYAARSRIVVQRHNATGCCDDARSRVHRTAATEAIGA